MAQLLRPGGYLATTVPGQPWMWSRHDEAHHHKRRYRLADYRRLFEAAGLTVKTASHFNTLLFAPIAAVRAVKMATGSTAADDAPCPRRRSTACWRGFSPRNATGSPTRPCRSGFDRANRAPGGPVRLPARHPRDQRLRRGRRRRDLLPGGVSLAAQRWLGLGPVLSSLAGYIASVGVSYLGNSRLTFRRPALHGAQVRQVRDDFPDRPGAQPEPVFFCTHALAWPLWRAMIPVVLMVPPATFVMSKLWAFRRRDAGSGRVEPYLGPRSGDGHFSFFTSVQSNTRRMSLVQMA